MKKDLVIGIDSSTTATKAIAWDATGRPVAEGRAPIPLANPGPGLFEQDPADWWGSTVAAVRGVLATVDPARIAAVGISNQRETVGLFDEGGAPLRPAIVWLDERAKRQVLSFSATFGEERIHAISGKPRDITPPVYRFVWLREHEPETWGRIGRIAEVHAFLTHRLTGEWATSTASADPMGVLDMAAMDWSGELLAALELSTTQLPRLVRPGGVTGQVAAAAAAETGLREGTPVVAAGGDGQCAGTGTDVFAAGRAYINLGTAVVSGSYGEDYAHDTAFRTMTAVAERGYIYESCVRTGTFLVDWLVRELFQIDPKQQPTIFSTLEAEAAASPIGARGLVLVPYWSGCMPPYWDTSARGVIAGLSASHGRGDVYRAMLEGIALEQAMVTRRIGAAVGRPVDHYTAIGGGASSDLWCQILADASGLAVQRSGTVEASSLGAAMAAAVGAGWFPSIAQAANAMAGRAVRTFEPRPQAVARYAELGAIYEELWPALSAWNRRLSAFAEHDHG
jgi:xylulokinase